MAKRGRKLIENVNRYPNGKIIRTEKPVYILGKLYDALSDHANENSYSLTRLGNKIVLEYLKKSGVKIDLTK